jgi:hypothetical protein
VEVVELDAKVGVGGGGGAGTAGLDRASSSFDSASRAIAAACRSELDGIVRGADEELGEGRETGSGAEEGVVGVAV